MYDRLGAKLLRFCKVYCLAIKQIRSRDYIGIFICYLPKTIFQMLHGLSPKRYVCDAKQFCMLYEFSKLCFVQQSKFFSICRFRYMWQQRWHQSGDLHSLFPPRMAMLERACAGQATSPAAHPTGPIPFSGVWHSRCRNHSSTHGVSGFASRSARGDSKKILVKMSRKLEPSALTMQLEN